MIKKAERIENMLQVFDPKPLTTDDTVMSLLLRGLILEYNGVRWCGLHPAVEDFLREKGALLIEEGRA